MRMVASRRDTTRYAAGSSHPSRPAALCQCVKPSDWLVAYCVCLPLTFSFPSSRQFSISRAVESAQAGTIVNLVPTNVTVTALSVTSALVTWSLMDLGSPVNGNGGQHHHQHHQPSEESPGSQQQHHHGSQQRIEITYRPVQDRYAFSIRIDPYCVHQHLFQIEPSIGLSIA